MKVKSSSRRKTRKLTSRKARNQNAE